MPAATIQAEQDRRWAVVRTTSSRGEAAHVLGMRRGTLNQWLAHHPDPHGHVSPAIPGAMQPASPMEIRDAGFWRSKAAKAEKERDDLQHLAAQLAGIREVQFAPAIWSSPPPSTKGRSILIAHTSDLHMGEVVEASEVDGINAYDAHVARERMGRYFNAICEIGPRWLHDDHCDGVLLTMGGDLISGDIHEELSRTNALTSHEQVAAVASVYEAGIRQLADNFGHVHVVAVPGNHGRTTHKPTAKLAAKLSYDILAASILKQQMQSDARVTWGIATGTDVRTIVYGRTILCTHGDKMGTGGGQGFAGPMLPIMRGAAKVRAQATGAGMSCDLMLTGHYHVSGQPPGVLANGSVIGYSEYGHAIRGGVEPPKQWAARFSLKWGLCETLAVQLAELPAKPRMKAMA